MRALGSRLVLAAAALGLVFGCGQSEKDTEPPPNGGGSSSGSSRGGTAGADRGGSTSGGQPDTQAGTGGVGGRAPDLVDCDPKKILCKRLAPTCDAGEVPSVEGSCFGACVKVERCGCNAAEQCPEPEQYTCWAKQHCGPYVR